MPRKRRHWVPGEGAHLISRFVDRRFYLADDSDRRIVLDCVLRAQKRWDWTWLSWALMSSHTHFGLIAGEVPPEGFFRSANTRFAVRYHRARGGQTLGPVLADRPQIFPVQRHALARMVAYHHRNPIRAGLVERARDSAWTSHRVYLRLDPAPSWFDVERALEALGFSDTAAGRREFDEFVMGANGLVRGLAETPATTAVPIVASARPSLDWDRVVSLARWITGLGPEYPIDSRARRAAQTRLLIARVAISELGQTYASVAQVLGMSTGGLFNLLARNDPQEDVSELVAQLRVALVRRDPGRDEIKRVGGG